MIETWRPTAAYLTRSRLLRFMDQQGLETYDDLLRRSVDEPEWFWRAVVRDLGISFYTPYTQLWDRSRGDAWTRWFVGATYNHVHDALDKHALGPRRDAPAVVWEGEEGATATLSFTDLQRRANQLANALVSLGIGRGDCVGIYLPMVPEVVISMMACSKIGAIYSLIYSGYAAPAVSARLADCAAVAVITADGYYRRGRTVAMKQVADDAVRAVPSVRHLLVSQRTIAPCPWVAGRDLWLHDLMDGQSASFETVPLDPNDPYMILYTSGTTGRPKGMVHTHAGFPVKSAQDMAHCFDVQEGDLLFWYTDPGWMMAPWLIQGGLILGAACFLYDGAPDYPQPDRLWSMIERHRVTTLGLSPTVIRALQDKGEQWVTAHDLESLRVLGSSGEPWDATSWSWFFRVVGATKRPIINYSGGTEVSGGILGCTTLQPIRSCSFTGPIPGMAADIVDDAGHPLHGEVGELVLRQPWPGMTQGFWHDPERYLQTYWSRLPGLWVHGDWAVRDDDGFWYIRGRSDDTIKMAGKRVGPAEVEAAATTHEAVRECGAIGVPDPVKGEALICFVCLRDGYVESAALREAIVATITAHLGRSLRPAHLYVVADLPKTRSNKIMRRALRTAYLGGTDYGDLSALQNPTALDDVARYTHERA